MHYFAAFLLFSVNLSRHYIKKSVQKFHFSNGTSKESIANFNRKSISRNSTYFQSYHLQAIPTGVKVERL